MFAKFNLCEIWQVLASDCSLLTLTRETGGMVFQLIANVESKLRWSGAHSNLWKFSLHTFYIFRADRNILIKLVTLIRVPN